MLRDSLAERETSLAPLLAAAVLEVLAETFPKARQRRRVLTALADAATRQAAVASVLRLGETEPNAKARARAEAATALLAALPAARDRSPLAQLAATGVRPLQPPRSGAEAVLLSRRPEDAREQLTAALAALERVHHQALAMAEIINDQLDRIDGDADHEPTLGASEGRYGGGTNWQKRPATVRDMQDAAIMVAASWAAQDEREEDADFEPSLASMSNRIDQRRWARGAGYDGDAEHDGREPSLGWRPTVNQSPAELALGALDGDREDACEDEGCDDGRREP